MLMVDLYRYQTVTDWRALAGYVSAVYVKATDGGGPAVVRADGQVNGAKSVGLPVGLYHYAQPYPSPEAQADVLVAEVRRLGATGLPPALDIEESTIPQWPNFAIRFLRRLVELGHPAPVLYASASPMRTMAPTVLAVLPSVRLWVAAYGINDGARRPFDHTYPVWAHQFTSNAVLPGVSGRCDLSDITQPQEDDVTPEQSRQLANLDRLNTALLAGDDKVTLIDTGAGLVTKPLAFVREMRALRAKVDAMSDALSDDEAKIISAVRAQSTGAELGADQLQVLIAALKDALPPGVTAGMITDAVRTVFSDAGQA